MDITALKGNIPGIVFDQLPDVINRFDISSILQIAHFIGQCDFESQQFTALRENLNYSAQALLKVFPTHFDSASAQAYARQPEKIGNHVYAGRMGNGDEASGDGWNYRGRGYIQLTGKSNYKALTDFLRTDPATTPDLLATPDLVATDYPLSSAGFYFQNHNIWSICDRGPTVDVITSITKIINGGTNGLADRVTAFNKYYRLLT